MGEKPFEIETGREDVQHERPRRSKGSMKGQIESGRARRSPWGDGFGVLSTVPSKSQRGDRQSTGTSHHRKAGGGSFGPRNQGDGEDAPKSGPGPWRATYAFFETMGKDVPPRFWGLSEGGTCEKKTSSGAEMKAIRRRQKVSPERRNQNLKAKKRGGINTHPNASDHVKKWGGPQRVAARKEAPRAKTGAYIRPEKRVGPHLKVERNKGEFRKSGISKTPLGEWQGRDGNLSPEVQGEKKGVTAIKGCSERPERVLVCRHTFLGNELGETYRAPIRL